MQAFFLNNLKKEYYPSYDDWIVRKKMSNFDFLT